ncbi:SHOCT domain-containing protein [Halalkaliarchaeum desulfuricum]|uniref:SHOCT domain-containing protein n=1 Tax=Halalkaliarchaeum desulfuricum TaxID=2055893 RepID=UPI00105AB064|nr:hypothetical protein [Halalkaliarchaeum desulfuricum]
MVLAVTSGGLSLFAFFIFAVFAFDGPGLFWLVLSVVPGMISVSALLLTLFVLWPIYLSLIGQIDSPHEYGTDRSDAQSNGDDPVALLKREFAQGNISEEEFERRLEVLLDTDLSLGDLGERRPDSERPTNPTVNEEVEEFDHV